MKKATLAKINGTEPAPWIKMTSQQTELDQPMLVRATIGPTLTLTLALASKPWSEATDSGGYSPIHPLFIPEPPATASISEPAALLAGTEATSPLAALQPLSPMPPPPSPAP